MKFKSMKTQRPTLHNGSTNCAIKRNRSIKTHIKDLFTGLGLVSMRSWALPTLIAGLGLILAGPATAQTFTTLYSFTDNSVGGVPYGGLVLSGNTLYGTTLRGTYSDGTVFALNTDGGGFTVLHDFTGGSDGSQPYAILILSGNTLYGTAILGGSPANGTVFAVTTNGTGFATLHGFADGSDGKTPRGGLVLSGNTLYGTAMVGGSFNHGTVFAVNSDGTGFTTLHSFSATSANSEGLGTNSDGYDPFAGLVLLGNTLYGTAPFGGPAGRGTVFAVNTDGTGFTTLHGFTALAGTSGALSDGTNSDGAMPNDELILSGNILYGTAWAGGSSGNGTLFSINIDGTGFTTLYSFSATTGTSGLSQTGANSDGCYPRDGLLLSGNALYGTASGGGSSGNGTVFAVGTNGAGFTTLYSFTGRNDGANPFAGVILSGNTLYGTALEGGSSGYGTVFSLTLPPSGPQFSVSVTPGSVTVDQGGDATYNLTIDSVDGFSGDVALSASGLPSGATASFSATSVSAPGSATLTITTPSTISPGTYTLTITGTSGSLIEQVTATLVVVAPNFSISASPSSQSVKAGSSATYVATVTASGGFDGVVSFSARGLPSGATASFSPASISGSGSSTMTVTTKSATRTGSTSFTITGTGPNGSPVHSTTVTLTVKK
jgi:uncharacterized repeat protein (TIGR03803 family)